MSSAPGTRFRLRLDSVAWSTLGEDTVLVQLDRDEIHVANGTGAVIIQSLREGATVDSLMQSLLDRFEVEPNQARADVEAFVGRLIEVNAVATVEEGPAT